MLCCHLQVLEAAAPGDLGREPARASHAIIVLASFDRPRVVTHIRCSSALLREHARSTKEKKPFPPPKCSQVL